MNAKHPSVGMIGLGIMGSAMAANLMRAGHHVLGFDVLARRRRDHRQAGGEVARNSRDVGRRAAIVICSLPSSDALLQTAAALAEARRGSPQPPHRGPRRGARDGSAMRLPQGGGRGGMAPIVIDTSTLPIAVKEDARRVLGARGTILLDCPLSGTGAQARTKDLVVYASGDRRAYHRVVPVLQGFARAHYYVGAFGAGSKMKFVANLLVAIHNVAAAEALVLAMKAGLDPAMALKVIADGAGSSRMLQVRGPMMVKGDYSDATMKLEVWQKDMTIIGDFARKLGCPTPLFAASAPLYKAAIGMGRRAEDTGAVCAVLEEMAGVKRTSSK
jgi:3-hydroxyisobutyrate dehydrogenase-like beta-hydroxyacid dehydrogenase